ncbi:unnamed protein product [Leptidea sinapis]|uniref:Uncharacterized protein n=1 Tax=Leptidea sinapis TaxID=189913 RepID=A0A5E4QVB8_9NEOP|nr:unnamed protein product [Leptidea sinapis]
MALATRQGHQPHVAVDLHLLRPDV